jgi:hypothetical protein
LIAIIITKQISGSFLEKGTGKSCEKIGVFPVFLFKYFHYMGSSVFFNYFDAVILLISNPTKHA